MCNIFGFAFLAAGLLLVKAQTSIVTAGSATIQSYPYIASVLRSPNIFSHVYVQTCSGAILTSKSVMTTARCVFGDQAIRWQIRVGSTWANRNGSTYSVGQIIVHPNYNARTYDNDIAILKTTMPIVFSNVVKAATIAGFTYKVADNKTAIALGWGSTSAGSTDQLRLIVAKTMTQEICVSRYATLRYPVTDNMLCTSWPDVQDECKDGFGGPLVNDSVVIGLNSWTHECGSNRFPRVYTRITKFTPWIQANA